MKRCSLAIVISLISAGSILSADQFNPTDETLKLVSKMKVDDHDWPQWGGSSHRNNTPDGKNIPHEWNLETGENVLWAMPLGSGNSGSPVVANGKVYVGTNNRHGYLKRYPPTVDLDCLIAFEETTGKFLWQASSPGPPGWHGSELLGSTAYCEETRLWYNSKRGEVLCLDAEGFRDGENDGPFQSEPNENPDEADIIWRYDMVGELGVFPHDICSCSVTCLGEYCFVITGNGVDQSHVNIPAPQAPSFICLEKNTGKLLWSDNSPGRNILHGQWSSPCVFERDGQAQVVMGGGDGWIYSFDPAGDGQGNAKLLWKFDGNPKQAIFLLGGRATRNHIISTPVFYDGLVYAGVGEDPEHGEGVGHYYCIDPKKRGDISLELAVDANGNPIAPRRLQSVDRAKGEKVIANPNSGAVWHYSSVDRNRNGKFEFEETMHRTVGTPAIKNDLLFIADFAGLVHCLDARKSADGKPVVHWTYDMYAATWGSVLIVDGKVYVGDEDGDMAIFELSKTLNLLAEHNMVNSVYSTPIVANDTLFISNKSTLFAIKKGARLKGGVKQGFNAGRAGE